MSDKPAEQLQTLRQEIERLERRRYRVPAISPAEASQLEIDIGKKQAEARQLQDPKGA